MQIAVIADFDQHQAGVLLMIGAKTAIVGASPFHWGLESERHLRWLHEPFARPTPIIGVLGHEDSLTSAGPAPFIEVDLTVLDDQLAFAPDQAGGTYAANDIVEDVRSGTAGGVEIHLFHRQITAPRPRIHAAWIPDNPK